MRSLSVLIPLLVTTRAVLAVAPVHNEDDKSYAMMATSSSSSSKHQYVRRLKKDKKKKDEENATSFFSFLDFSFPEHIDWNQPCAEKFECGNAGFLVHHPWGPVCQQGCHKQFFAAHRKFGWTCGPCDEEKYPNIAFQLTEYSQFRSQ